MENNNNTTMIFFTATLVLVFSILSYFSIGGNAEVWDIKFISTSFVMASSILFILTLRLLVKSYFSLDFMIFVAKGRPISVKCRTNSVFTSTFMSYIEKNIASEKITLAELIGHVQDRYIKQQQVGKVSKKIMLKIHIAEK